MVNPEIVNITKPALFSNIYFKRYKKKFKAPSYVVVRDCVRAFDGLLLIAASTLERTPYVQQLFGSSDKNQLLANVVGGCIAFGMMSETRSYHISRVKNLSIQITNVAKSIAAGTVGVTASLTVLHDDVSHIMYGPLRWALISTTVLISAKLVITPFLRKSANVGLFAERIAVVGVNEVSHQFIKQANQHPDTCNIVGLYDDRASRVPDAQENIKLIGNIDQLFIDSQADPFDYIVITLPLSAQDRLFDICHKVYPAIAEIQLVGEAVGLADNKRNLRNLGGNLVLTVHKKPLNDWQLIQKNIFDRVAGTMILLTLSPLLLLTAVAIKIDSKGPVFFKQPRVGYNNLLFSTYKFRSMYAHMADIYANQQTTRDDPRITKLGKYLRKYSIDELPQLINVIKGSMSLVGPRPHAPGNTAAGKFFSEISNDYTLRHRVKPGITGWAQVNGWRGEIQDVESLNQRVTHDLHYIQHWSLWFDVKIILLTIIREIKSGKAY